MKQQTKTKKTFTAIARFDSDFWKTKKDDVATIYKVKWYNGEHYYIGIWILNNIEFMLPSEFFDDKN